MILGRDPIKFNISKDLANHGNVITCSFLLKGNDDSIRIDCGMYIYYKDKRRTNMTLLVNSNIESVYTEKENKYHSIGLKVPYCDGDKKECFVMININGANFGKKVDIDDIKVRVQHKDDTVGVVGIYEDNMVGMIGANNVRKRSINFYPYTVRNTGYGILGDNVFRTLKKHKYNIVQSNENGPNADISFNLSIPFSWRRIEKTFNVGYTMIEASRIPTSWVSKCNEMDRLFVPLKSNVEIFKNCGVNIPIDVVPIGIDETIFDPNKSIPVSTLVPSEGYKFLIINDDQPRKNNQLVIDAFLDEFKEEISISISNSDKRDKLSAENKVYLVIRTHGRHEGKNVIWIDHFLQDSELVSLIKSCDCMVSASSGEAGDMNILSAMALEKPVIVSKELAHSEYIIDDDSDSYDSQGNKKKKNGFFIETERITQAFADPFYKYMFNELKGAMWIEPSYESLKEKMRFVYENRDVANRVGKNAREYILKNRTLDVCIKPMTKIFDEIFNKIYNTLSVCIIIKNEVDYLKRLLENVGDIADELIAVDGGSTDGTRDILKEHYATIIDSDVIINYGELRNLAISFATKDWILFMDADEILEPELHDALKTRDFLALCNKNGNDAIAFKRKNYVDDVLLDRIMYPDGCPQTYPDYQYRLFKNDKKIKYKGHAHESLMGYKSDIFSDYHIIHMRSDVALKSKMQKSFEIHKQLAMLGLVGK